jgi:toxin ParE1/3/4
MRDLIWLPDALQQLERIVDYIAERNYAAAARMDSNVRHHIDLLKSHSFIGRPGRVEGTRELIIHPNYIVIYEVNEKVIRILRVLHAHQEYP